MLNFLPYGRMKQLVTPKSPQTITGIKLRT